MTKVTFVAIASLLSATACATDDAGLDDFGELRGLDAKSDAFGSVVRFLGELDYGESDAPTAYAGTTTYQGYRFRATMGDHVEARVRAEHGIPLVWILADDFQIVSAPPHAKLVAILHLVNLSDVELTAHGTLTLSTTTPRS